MAAWSTDTVTRLKGMFSVYFVPSLNSVWAFCTRWATSAASSGSVVLAAAMLQQRQEGVGALTCRVGSCLVERGVR